MIKFENAFGPVVRHDVAPEIVEVQVVGRRCATRRARVWWWVRSLCKIVLENSEELSPGKCVEGIFDVKSGDSYGIVG